MRKLLVKFSIITILISFSFPSAVMAAWWNPFTWKIFNRTPEKVEEPNKKVEELKKKPTSINSASKQSAPAKNIGARPISSASPNIKEKVPYIVQIVCPVNGGTMSGTGEIIYGNSASDNKVITNKHVLNGAVGPCSIYRTFNYENQPTLFFKSSNTFIFSKNYDLAVIAPNSTKLTSANSNLTFSVDSDLLDKTIFVLGYPPSAGNNITLTKGIISGTETINGIVMYKTDAKIDSGNSGGAVFDEKGKFIGIPTIASQGDFSSYGYIIPAKIVKSFLGIVEQEGYGKQNWQHPQLSLYSVSPSNTVPDIAPRAPQDTPRAQDDPSLTQKIQEQCLAQGFKVVNDELAKIDISNLNNQRNAFIRARFNNDKANTTQDELNSLSPQQRQIYDGNDFDAMIDELNKISAKLEANKTKLSRISDFIYTVRLLCGTVTKEDQIIHELEGIKNQLYKITR